MTATTRARGRPPFGAVLGFTLRACLPARRWWTLAIPCGAAVGFGLLSRLSDEPADQAFATVADVGLFSLLIPIACLVIGDAVLGAELRSGTFHFTFLSPAPIWTIVTARWLGGWIVSLVTLVPAMALAAVVAQSPESVPAIALATAGGISGLCGPVRAHRLRDPPDRRVVAGRGLLHRAAPGLVAHRHRATLTDVGGPSGVRRPGTGHGRPAERRAPAGVGRPSSVSPSSPP